MSADLHSHPAAECLHAEGPTIKPRMHWASSTFIACPRTQARLCNHRATGAPLTVTHGTYKCLGTSASVASAAVRSNSSPCSPSTKHPSTKVDRHGLINASCTWQRCFIQSPRRTGVPKSGVWAAWLETSTHTCGAVGDVTIVQPCRVCAARNAVLNARPVLPLHTCNEREPIFLVFRLVNGASKDPVEPALCFAMLAHKALQARPESER